MEIRKVNIANKLAEIEEHWNPKVIAELNKQMVKLAKLKGEFVMHKHEHEDELFMVISGQLFIEMEEQTLAIGPGEFVVIPKGVNHKPYAPEEVSILLFEPQTTLNTGNINNELTKTKLDYL